MAFAIKFITYIMYVCVGIWTHFCFLRQIEDFKNSIKNGKTNKYQSNLTTHPQNTKT